MSLDCYPFSDERSLGFAEQPIAMDVAYDDDLLIYIMDNCQSISIHDLNSKNSQEPMRKVSIGRGVVIDQVIYCRRGDYLACVGHKNGLLSVYIIIDWRQSNNSPAVLELGVNGDSKDCDRRDKLSCISCCQRTGNLAAGCGDTVLIYKHLGDDSKLLDSVRENDGGSGDNDSVHSRAETIKNNLESSNNLSWEQLPPPESGNSRQYFRHIITIKLSLWALKIDFVENYLSVMSGDHVQVLKLELLPLQIQAEGIDTGKSTDQSDNHGSGSNCFNGEIGSTAATIGTTTCSMASDTNSTTTNISSFTNTDTTNGTGSEQSNCSVMSIITMNPQTKIDSDPDSKGDSNQSADDCITWNLNTKKLVKLPSLMHNTSANLSSYHIYHPIELLGPASESIACRVSASIYSAHYGQNQLEAVVMLCRQFESDKDPVKATHLQPIYLSCGEEKLRLNKSAHNIDHDCKSDQDEFMSKEMNLLKSDEFDLVASVSYYVSTLTYCYVYALHGKKVTKSQTITNPDLCLDLRPDLLNIYLLTPLGLQICSSGVCDSTFRYEWSSSADLNLSFIAIDCKRVLTTANYVVLVGCSVDEMVEYRRKPDLASLFERIVDTVNHCNSVSIRSNMLTYLHATAQLTLSSYSGRARMLEQATVMLCKQLLQKKQTNIITNNRIDKTIKHLLDISMCDTKALMKSLGLVDMNNDRPSKTLAASQSCEDITVAAESLRPKAPFERSYSPFTWGNWRVSSSPSRLSSSADVTRSHYSHSIDMDEDARDGISSGGNHDSNNNNNKDQDELDNDDDYEMKLKFIAEIPTIELIDLLADADEGDQEDFQAARACIGASINALESQFILNNLREKFATN